MAAGIDRRGFLAALGGIAAVPPSHAGRQVPVEGAVGDGVADDTAAIQAALDAAATGGGSVHLPAGRYRLTSPLRPASLVTLARNPSTPSLTISRFTPTGEATTDTPHAMNWIALNPHLPRAQSSSGSG